MNPNESVTNMSGRRDFLKTSVIGATVATAALSGILSTAAAVEPTTPFVMPPLPYPENALEPSISSKTLSIHYDKHHRRFMQEVIARIKGTDYENASLEKIIKETYGGITLVETLHLMAILAWNHDFYWKSMKPNGGGEMPVQLKNAVVASFGSVDAFKTKFKEAAMTLGSGWAWLVVDNGKLAVTYTIYHETPLLKNQKPLLTIDCWEHSYYLDYQDRKGDYVDAFINKLANWQFAESNMPAPVTAPVKTEKK